MANLAGEPIVHRPLDDLKLVATVMDGDQVDVVLTQLEPKFMMNLRLDKGDEGAVYAAQTALSLELPANNLQSADGQAWWLGPDEWMIIRDDRGAHRELPAHVTAAMGDAHHSAVDVSHQFEGFGVSGPLARDLLAHIVTLDLHPRTLKPGSCAQTVAAHTQIMLGLDADGQSFTIYTRRSFIAYVWQRLVDAAADMNLEIRPRS